MTRRLPSLNALRAFEAAARHLSFTRAADELAVTQGAVSRQVKALETHLGLDLFHRLTRALELTDAGREYQSAMTDAFDRVEQATSRLMRRLDRQILTVSVLPTFAMRWLIPRLSGFIESNPGVEVRLITSILPIDFSREDIDVAIRVGTPSGGEGMGARIELRMTEDWTNVCADRLIGDVLIPVCSPALQCGRPPLRKPADLRRHTLLHTTTRPHAWTDWLTAAGMSGIERQDEPAFGHFFMTLQAASEGRGVAMVPEVLVAGDVAAGSLVKPFDIKAKSAGAYYFLCRKPQYDLPKIAVFREWLHAEVALMTAPPRVPSRARA